MIRFLRLAASAAAAVLLIALVPAVSARAAAPAPAPTPASQITLPAGPGTAPGSTTANPGLSGRAKAGAVLGAILLIAVLWAFSQGFGLLGGRPRTRRRLPSRDGPAGP